MSKARPVDLIKDFFHFLSLGFGSGLSPFAPGTMGTIVAVPLYVLVMWYIPELMYLATLFIIVVGVYLCGRTGRALGVHDHPAIVWDEFAGYFVTMLFAPLTVTSVILGFVFFRFFDILKPWPINVIDSRLKGGLGVMLDDILAGVFAMACVQLSLYVIEL